MRKEITAKTTTEIEQESGLFLISSIPEEGNETPAITKSRVLDKPKTIDGTSGEEGELMITHSGSKVGNINVDGELVIDVDGDDSNKYNKENEDLTYDE